MAELKVKCSSCGYYQEYQEGAQSVQCESCDSPIFIRNVKSDDDEKKKNLLENADRWRLSGDFARAERAYEAIIREYPDEAEAYWGCLMSEYGVSFVDDKSGGKKKPTINRTSRNRILEHEYYKKALDLVDLLTRPEWERIAKELDRINDRYYKLSQNSENQYDIFISFKQREIDNSARDTSDCLQARELYKDLTEEGYRVFFSPETLKVHSGEEYEPLIYAALQSSKVMLLIASSRENAESPWVKNEWNRYQTLSKEKEDRHLIPIWMGKLAREETLKPEGLERIQYIDTRRYKWDRDLFAQIKHLIPKKKKEEKSIQEKKAFSGYTGVGAGSVSNNFLVTGQQNLQIEEWEKAKEEFDKAHKLQPRNAEAIVGGILAEKHCHTLEEYRQKLISDALSVRAEEKLIAITRDVCEKEIDCYAVKNYFSENDARQLLPDVRRMDIKEAGLRQNYYRVKKEVEIGSKFGLACECADGEYAEELERVKDSVISELKQAIDWASSSEKKELNRLTEEYQREYEKQKEVIRRRSEEAKKQRQEDYEKACAAMKNQRVDEAIQLFAKVGDYEGAQEKLRPLLQVREKIKDIGDGATYLIRQLIKRFPGDVSEYLQSEKNVRENAYPGKHKWWILIYYIGTQLLVMGSSGMAWIAALIGVGALVVLWKKNKPRSAYYVFAVIMTLAAGLGKIDTSVSSEGISPLSASLAVAIVLIVSLVRKKGYARWRIQKKEAEISLQNLRVVKFNEREKEFRNELNSIWQAAFQTDYNGVQMRGINDTVSAMEGNNSFYSFVVAETQKLQAKEQQSEETEEGSQTAASSNSWNSLSENDISDIWSSVFNNAFSEPLSNNGRKIYQIVIKRIDQSRKESIMKVILENTDLKREGINLNQLPFTMRMRGTDEETQNFQEMLMEAGVTSISVNSES